MATAYENALEDAKRSLSSLVKERDRIDAEITKTQRTIAALANMLDSTAALAQLEAMYEISGPRGITDVVRNIFRSNATLVWNAKSLRDYMVSTNVDLTRYSNALAAIHTILRRLQDGNEIVPSGDAAFDGGYRWNSAFEADTVKKMHEAWQKNLDNPNNVLYTSGMRPFRRRRRG